MLGRCRKRILQSNPDAKLMLSRRNLFCEYDVRSCELRLRQALRYSRTSLTRRQESATQLEPGNSNWRRQQQTKQQKLENKCKIKNLKNLLRRDVCTYDLSTRIAVPSNWTCIVRSSLSTSLSSTFCTCPSLMQPCCSQAVGIRVY